MRRSVLLTALLGAGLPAMLLAAAPLAAQESTSAAATPAMPAAAAGPVDYGPSEGVLTLDEVLDASAATAPQIIAALTRTRQAEARALSAQGAFDTVFSAEGTSRVEGYYDGSEVHGEAKQPLSTNGGYVYGKYRASRGSFPVYEDEKYTNKLGELKVGALYSLLRDRLIDARRSKTMLAANDIDIARFEAQATAIGVQARAAAAYQKWVSAGLKLRAYEELLALAETRNRAITRQVQLGARPEILLVENEQNLVKRTALVVQAEQDFRAAANGLSLYYRDANGTPRIVGPERLPESIGAFSAMALDADFTIEDRPDMQILLEQIDQATTGLALAENDLRPRLDAFGEAGKDIGAEGLGGSSRTPFEVKLGFRFTVPLQNRAARGKLAEAEAKIDELSIKQDYLRDQIRAEVAGLGIAVEGARRLVDTSTRERDLARRLAVAERRRFELGSSDFFLVNQREETATDAQVKLIEAMARIAGARTDLAAARADRGALGLTK
ncbi:TolC family protein [Novosphingobium sp. YJ-S2-02]|uniref:TolC family protein n=1 Tax=Novosphingobium aureum TaxID=2792964 RepID=A0A931MKD0_9SPHN|nr:TolC family protein [Novosphingobium aureum]MBH0112673.1 TolC family protein [Novosphingobium aureum]